MIIQSYFRTRCSECGREDVYWWSLGYEDKGRPICVDCHSRLITLSRVPQAKS